MDVLTDRDRVTGKYGLRDRGKMAGKCELRDSDRVTGDGVGMTNQSLA
jgi:hypothetical protein